MTDRSPSLPGPRAAPCFSVRQIFNAQNLPTLLAWALCLCLPWLWLWPVFFNPSFSMIDDAVQMPAFELMASEFSQWWDTPGFRGDFVNGRLRPFYWIFRFLFYYLPCKLNPLGWYTVHTLFLYLIITAMFFFIYRLTRSRFGAFLGCALWVLNSKTAENYTRFGTAEVWQLLWFSLTAVAGFYFFSGGHNKKKKWTSFAALAVFLCFNYFSKETTILLLPAAAVLLIGSFLFRKQQLECSIFFAANLILFSFQRFLLPPASGYAAAYALSPGVIIANLGRYTWRIQWFYLLFACLMSYSLRLFLQLRRKTKNDLPREDFWQFAFLMFGMLFFLVLLPWEYAAPRYLVIADFFFAYFMAIECVRIWTFWLGRVSRLFKKPGVPVRIARMAVLCVPFLTGGWLAYLSQTDLSIYLRYQYGLAKYPTAVQELRYFSEHARKDSRVLIFYLQPELVQAAATYLSHYFNRPDIVHFTLSDHADGIRDKTGYPVYRVHPNELPGILKRIDYIYWNRRGAHKPELDAVHQALLASLMKTPDARALRKIYDTTHAILHPTIKDGTQIWEIDRSKLPAA